MRFLRTVAVLSLLALTTAACGGTTDPKAPSLLTDTGGEMPVGDDVVDVQGLVDTGLDLFFPDLAKDIENDVPGSFGWPCEQNDECDSGL